MNVTCISARGQTEACVPLPKGKHTLQLILGDWTHILAQAAGDVGTHHRRCGINGAQPTRLSPLALAEHRHAAAIGVDAVDVGRLGTDQPVEVEQARVAAWRRVLLRREFR